MIAFRFTLSRQAFDKFVGVMNLYTYKLQESDYFCILHLHLLIIPLCNSH